MTLISQAPVEFTAKAATYAITAAETGKGFTNVGAPGAIDLDLPAATVGLHYYFYVGAAQAMQIDPSGTETISLPSDGIPGAAGKHLTANAIGETVHLVCAVAGTWAVFGHTGTWVAES